MRIALAQMAAGTDVRANLHTVLRLIDDAASLDAELVVLPEAAMCSFARPRADAAEPLDGPFAAAVRQAAQRTGVTVVVGIFTTTAEPNKVRNTLLVTGPDAETHYDKIHLFDAYGYAESDQIEPGEEVVTVTIGGITFGLATCYDIRFPAQFTELANAGAQAILVPTSWAPGPGKLEQWRALVIARALDSTTYVLGVGQAEPQAPNPEQGRQPTGIGHSIVAGPLGELLLELGPAPELVVVEVDVDRVAEARAQLPVLANARFASQLRSAGE